MQKNRPKVGIVKGNYQEAYLNIQRLFELINYTPQKSRIFIKPNICGKYAPDSGIITSPELIEALIVFFRNFFPEKEIIIGEGSIRPKEMEEIFGIAGYREFEHRYQVKLVNLDKVSRVDHEWKYGNIRLPEFIHSCEYINVAKMKTHTQTTVTLCLKNQKGVLNLKTKKKFHQKLNLHSAIHSLSSVVKPDLNIIDGIDALEGNGPVAGGQKKTANLLIASKDIWAIDNVAATIMGFDVNEIEHIPVVCDYMVEGENIWDCFNPFKKPQSPITVPELNLTVHFDKAVCSHCTSCFDDTFAQNLNSIVNEFVAGNKAIKKNVILGQSFPVIPSNEKVLYLGDCACEHAKEYDLPYVKGCPPEIEDVHEHLLVLFGK